MSVEQMATTIEGESQPLSIFEIDSLIESANKVLAHQDVNKSNYDRLVSELNTLNETLERLDKESDLYQRAGTLIGTATERTITKTLNVITGVINKALAILFPKDPRSIRIEHVMYRDTYPHFNVILETGIEKRARKFTQSGRGVRQLISFLFLVTIIDARKARPILITDELLSGLHPQAKSFVRDIIKSLSGRFQFIMAEYSLDIGKEYLVDFNGSCSNVSHYDDGDYYAMLVREGVLEASG